LATCDPLICCGGSVSTIGRQPLKYSHCVHRRNQQRLNDLLSRADQRPLLFERTLIVPGIVPGRMQRQRIGPPHSIQAISLTIKLDGLVSKRRRRKQQMHRLRRHRPRGRGKVRHPDKLMSVRHWERRLR